MHLEAWNFAVILQKVSTNNFLRQKSSRLHSGIKNVLEDSLEEALETRRRICSFSAAIGPEILHRASLLFIYVTPDVQSHLKSIKESKMSSKTPWRMLWRLKGECPLPEGPEILHIAYSMFIHVSLGVQIHIHYTQEWRMSSKTHWRIIWRLIGEYPLPVNLKAFNFPQNFLNAYIPDVQIHPGSIQE